MERAALQGGPILRLPIFAGPVDRVKRVTPQTSRFASAGPPFNPLQKGYAMTMRVHVREYRRVRFGLVERVRRHTRRFPFDQTR